MKNLRIQDGCWNCAHLYAIIHHDDPSSLFCNITNDRPKSGAILFSDDKGTISYAEDFYHDINGKRLHCEVAEKAWDDWEGWSASKSVEEYNICQLPTTKAVGFLS